MISGDKLRAALTTENAAIVEDVIIDAILVVFSQFLTGFRSKRTKIAELKNRFSVNLWSNICRKIRMSHGSRARKTALCRLLGSSKRIRVRIKPFQGLGRPHFPKF